MLVAIQKPNMFLFFKTGQTLQSQVALDDTITMCETVSLSTSTSKCYCSTQI